MKQLDGGRQRPKYRLSPNEVELLKKEETERRRKLRIVQVREQAKTAAAKIRNDVKHERKRQLVKLAQEIENQLEDEKEEEVKRLEQRYDNTLRTIGQGHTQAIITDKKTSHAEQQYVAYENKQKAEERHQEALRKVALDKAYQEYEETKHVRDRRAALTEEKKRAAEVASRPPPPPDPINDVLLNKYKLKKPIPLTDMNAFSSTHYHIPDFAVEKAPAEQQHDGKAAGDEEDERTKEEVSERKKKEHDQLVRARIRGNEALKKEKLKHEYDTLMADLSLQQRADRRRRQQVVSKLPKQVFLPPDRRMEELEDKQMEMERAFEDMYMKQMNLSSNLSLTLDPNPMPATPAEGEDDSLVAEEDSPVVIPTMPAVNPALREVTNISRTQAQPTQHGKPETVLKKLLNRIKEQRSEVEAEKTQSVDCGQENLDWVSKEKEMADAGPNFTTARCPASKPAADPQLDLSPLRAPGNQKPQKSPALQKESSAEDEDTLTTETTNNEEGFLDKLKGRLQVVEAQKEYLDQKMRERQQQQPQQQPPSTYFPYSSTEPSVMPQGPNTYFPTSSTGPQRTAEVSGGMFHPSHPTLAHMRGPAGDVPVTAVFSADQWKSTEYGGNGLPSQRQSTAPPVFSETQPYGLGGTQGVTSAVMNNVREPVMKGLPLAGISQAANQMSAGSGYPSSSMTTDHQSGSQALSQSAVRFSHSQPFPLNGSGLVSLGGGPSSASQDLGVHRPVNVPGMTGLTDLTRPGVTGLSQFSGSVGQLYTGPTSGHPYPTTVGSASIVRSAPGDSVHQPSWLHIGSVGASGNITTHTQPLSSNQLLSSAASLTRGNEFSSLPASLPLFHGSRAPGLPLADTGDGFMTLPLSAAQGLGQSQDPKPQIDFGSLASRLASGLNEQDRMQRLREYQRQLIEKHQERMQSLQENRASIQKRQADSAMPVSSSSLSTSQGLADPASLVPYTLRTVSLQSESSATGKKAPPSMLSTGMVVPLSAGLGSSLQSGQPAHGSSRIPMNSVSSGPLTSSGVAASYRTMEPILAGSSGVQVDAHQFQHQSSGLQPSNLPDFRDKVQTSGANGPTSKFDSIRKSLPFDNPDDTLHQADGEAGDTDGISVADDSHISSSTDRGSPALGSRSNKSSTSGKSGSGVSGTSDGSLGGSSLVARAEEKRLSFEQRQQELQHQLAEIQHQKDALLQRYHGNQQRVSSQEEALRHKLKTAQAATASSQDSQASDSAFRQQMVAAALSLGVHQSGSPSMELEEGSLSSERMSGARSWAMELEEYSLSHKSGEKAYKSPSSMTLEEFSITSDWSGGAARDGTKAADRSGMEARPSSGLSSLEEYSINSSVGQRPDGGIAPLNLSARGSRESLSAVQGVADSASQGSPDSARGRLDIRDLMQDLGGGQGGTLWPEASASGQSDAHMTVGDSDSRLPPPPTRQPVPIMEYEPHELSTILEVDTPQTGTKNAATTGEGTEKAASRRYIDFGRHASLPEDDRNSESKFSASGSSASSDVRSVIEVRPGMLKSGGVTLMGSNGREASLAGKGEETLFRENVGESSTLKATVPTQAADQNTLDSQLLSSRDASSVSGSQGFQSLELTMDSLTAPSLSAEESQTHGYLDVSSSQATSGRTNRDKEHVDDVLRQARQFNQDLMAAIHRQSADVFDQSSISTLSHTAADSSRASQ